MIEAELPKVFHVRNAFSPDILGKDFCIENLGMSEHDFFVDDEGKPSVAILGLILLVKSE